MFDLIIFDCDGTLTDSEKANNQATLDVLSDIGINYTMDHALKHWVGTGNKSPRRYALAEANALKLLRRHYPEYLQWLAEKSGQVFLSEPKDSDD